MQVRARRDSLGGTWQEVRRVAVSVDARASSTVAFSVEADGCEDILVVPDDNVALVDVEVVDNEGRAIGRAHEGGANRALTVCSPLALSGSILIRPHLGRGLVAVVLARSRGEIARDLSVRPEIAWVATPQSLDTTKSARSALLAKLGYASPTQSVGQLAMGRRTSVPIEGFGTGCARVDVVAGAPLALVHATLWGGDDLFVSSADGAESVTLFPCVPASGALAKGKLRLDLETRGRPGPFAMLLRKEKWQDPAFVKHPIAASRMLQRAAEGSAMLLEGQPVSARAATVDVGRGLSWEATVPAGKCWRVAAGAEGEGTGLELRIFDAATGEELDRSHAADAVAARACAAATPLTVRAELRATSGKLDVVVSERN
jgi:hypothetical protein